MILNPVFVKNTVIQLINVIYRKKLFDDMKSAMMAICRQLKEKVSLVKTTTVFGFMAEISNMHVCLSQ